ncbi:DUF2167 domain-containing protein [Pasteurella multocida]|nr:DUF2167 domain-containing protein [Pasteurella multocida]URH91294.1 DUF2167 domain-containing protein [Pasteurella multocida]
MLGREGYIELGFITGEDRIKVEQHIAQDLLSRIRFNTGKRYADFDPATDAVYEHGLTSLIGGITLATKLGLFAVITAFVAKFWKILVVVLLALGLVLKGLWRNKAKKEANKQIVE